MADPLVPGFILIILAKAGKVTDRIGVTPRSTPPASLHTTPDDGGVGSCATHPLAKCLLATTKLAKTDRDPISTSGPSILIMRQAR